MKYKTADLSGALLDLAVDRARSVGPTGERDWMHYTRLDWFIERERIGIEAVHPGWNAFYGPKKTAGLNHYGPMCNGPTPLIAAMRAFCASRFGEEVELP